MTHQPTALKIHFPSSSTINANCYDIASSSFISLAIGSPLSALSTFQAKVASINAKHGPFDACVVVGDLFKEGSDGSELEGIALPVPTYFTIGQNALPDVVKAKIQASHGEVAPNLVYLGKASVLVTAQGLKIGCTGGKYDVDTYAAEDTNPFSPFLTKTAASTVLANPRLSPQGSDPSSLAEARTTPLPSAFQGLDLLLLPSAPPGISLLSPTFPTSGVTVGQSALEVAEIIRKARPRYTFWADGAGFWEREPFGWSGAQGEERWTRSVKLGQLGAEGDKKARWFYAFTLPPQTPTSPTPARPTNITPNPFTMPIKTEPVDVESNIQKGKKRAMDAPPEEESVKRERTDRGPPPENYVCKICGVAGHWLPDCPVKSEGGHPHPPGGYKCNICQSPDHFIRDCPNKATARPKQPPRGYTCRACGVAEQHFLKECPVVLERNEMRNKRKELGPAECWFCLSNPKVTKHLIVSIGSETYVTLPKGQLIPTTSRHLAQGGTTLVPGGGHVLIIPIAHHPTLLSIPAEDALPIISEVESTKSALTRCYAQYNAVPVMWEVGRLSGRGGHAHVQVVPIPQEMADKVEDAFRKAGESQGLDWEEDPEKALSRAGKAGNYFKVELPGGGKMVHLLKGGFDLQFGRMVLAGLLGLHHRVDWKECSQSEEEEKEDAMKFKKAFTSMH